MTNSCIRILPNREYLILMVVGTALKLLRNILFKAIFSTVLPDFRYRRAYTNICGVINLKEFPAVHLNRFDFRTFAVLGRHHRSYLEGLGTEGLAEGTSSIGIAHIYVGRWHNEGRGKEQAK
jgi:hypothetical protein